MIPCDHTHPRGSDACADGDVTAADADRDPLPWGFIDGPVCTRKVGHRGEHYDLESDVSWIAEEVDVNASADDT